MGGGGEDCEEEGEWLTTTMESCPPRENSLPSPPPPPSATATANARLLEPKGLATTLILRGKGCVEVREGVLWLQLITIVDMLR